MKKLVLLAMLALPGVAFAQSAGRLEEDCRKWFDRLAEGRNSSGDASVDAGFCQGVFTGIQAVMVAAYSDAEGRYLKLKVREISVLDLIGAFLAHMKVHQDLRDKSFEEVVLPVVYDTYLAGPVKAK